VAEKGVPARVLAVRPYAGQLEVEVAFLPHALPEGLEAPAIIRAAALQMALAPGGGAAWRRAERCLCLSLPRHHYLSGLNDQAKQGAKN
jgi:hypothetical protein